MSLLRGYFRRAKFHQSTDELELMDASATFEDRSLMMGCLPLEQRQVIELKYFQHFTFEEIGGQLGLSSNTAKTRLYAALGKMKKESTNK
ncbi:MAG: RNA polymerase sigma factor (sigma-70 family) [Patiriisocius sp.]